MKKIVLSFALMLGAISFANAQSVNQDSVSVNNEQAVAMAQNPDEWKEVKTEDLAEKVRTVVEGFEADYTVKSVLYNETTKQAKITLTSKTDASEKVVVLDEEGKEVL